MQIIDTAHRVVVVWRVEAPISSRCSSTQQQRDHQRTAAQMKAGTYREGMQIDAADRVIISNRSSRGGGGAKGAAEAVAAVVAVFLCFLTSFRPIADAARAG